MAVFLASCAPLPLPQPPEAETSVRLIAPGQPYETPYFVLDSRKPGPVVLLEAGLHGDELAPVEALDRLLPRFRVLSGKLIVLPRMNRPACDRNVRYLNEDMNRVFPGLTVHKNYERVLARDIFMMVGREGVEWVLTGHESIRLHTPEQPGFLGQTIIYGVTPEPPGLPTWLAAINARVAEHEAFYPVFYPNDGSSTENFIAAYNLRGGFAVETYKSFTWERRVAMQEIVFTTFLDSVGLEYTLAGGPEE